MSIVIILLFVFPALKLCKLVHRKLIYNMYISLILFQALEQFSIQTKTLSDLLDKFTKLFQDSTEEYPMEIHSIKNVLHAQSIGKTGYPNT